MNLPWRGSFLLFDRSLFFVAVSMYSYEGYCISPFSSSPPFFLGGGHEIHEQNHSKIMSGLALCSIHPFKPGEKTSTQAPKSTPPEAEVVLASDSEDVRWGVFRQIRFLGKQLGFWDAAF